MRSCASGNPEIAGSLLRDAPGMTIRKTMRLPFFYGWIIVVVTFVTMAIGVNARTAFSLFFPPIIDEFGWERGITAGAFSFGFLVSAAVSPLIGRLMDRAGPRAVMELGVALMGGGLLLAPLTTQPWHLYLTIGVMVGAGSVCLGYSGQSLFLPNWFIRRRGLAIGLAFAGVGIGSMTLLPWVQLMIEQTGWRTACTAMGVMVLVALAPINLLLRKRPEDIGLEPDGDAAPSASSAKPVSNIVDPVWAGTDWTLRRALCTARFWWISLGYFGGLYIWYAVQVHQTKYLLDIGFSPSVAVWALGAVSLLGIPGQIWLGHLSDRVGREWIWAASCVGFAICFAALIALKSFPSLMLVYVMVFAQGALGYGLTSIMGAVVLEIFQGKHYGSIFGTIMLAALAGGAAGPWVTGFLYDLTGSYTIAFAIAIGVSALSAIAIWLASPGKIRAVAGQLHRIKAMTPDTRA
jgi:MFS family permease